MKLLAIDPGNEKSAFAILNNGVLGLFGKFDNFTLLQLVRGKVAPWDSTHCAIETLEPRGMPTSFEEMQTQLWAGRFYEAWAVTRGDQTPQQVFRHAVKMHHCGKTTANDSNIRAALIDRYGGETKAIGGKRCKQCKGRKLIGRQKMTCPSCEGSGWWYPPGPLHGVSADVWQALALGLYALDRAEK